jgi:glutamine synthetase
MRELLGDGFVDLFTALKQQELDKFSSRITDAEYETYLGVV